ncbi:MAG: class E sortase [Rubrobacteraceae bacterium]
MKTYSYKKTRTKGMISGLLSLAMIGAGVALIASFIFAGGLGTVASNSADPGGFSIPSLGGGDDASAGGPEDTTLRLTIPDMSRVDDAEIPSTQGTDIEALDSNKAIHLAGTGFPWQDEANVYIAGHRLGYPASDSFLAFYDLPNLENGDEVFVTDAEGTRYTYEVFEQTTVPPTDLSVTEPVPGRNILTLQTCTLPDYSQRLVVQAELVEVA